MVHREKVGFCLFLHRFWHINVCGRKIMYIPMFSVGYVHIQALSKTSVSLSDGIYFHHGKLCDSKLRFYRFYLISVGKIWIEQNGQSWSTGTTGKRFLVHFGQDYIFWNCLSKIYRFLNGLEIRKIGFIIFSLLWPIK